MNSKTADEKIVTGKPGRPRRNGSKSQNQRAEILDAAVRLFKKNGYSETSMSAIARESGLGQSSLYYWFKNKQDIVKELLATNRNPLNAAKEAEAAGEDAAGQLRALLYADTLALCQLPFDYRLLETVARKGGEEFADLFKDYAVLVGGVQKLIELGVQQGVFECPDPATYAVAIVAADEGAQHRFHNQQWEPAAGKEVTAEAIAEAAANLSVRGLMG
jgi:TetR/AcrR family transcriptional regulator